MATDHVTLSTRDFPSGFAQHGEFRVHQEADGLMVWRNSGPFNLETMQAYAKLRLRAAQQWQLQRRWFAAVVHWHQSALMSPEAFQAYRESFEHYFGGPHTLVAIAWVVPPGIEGIEIMHPPFQRLLDQRGLLLRLFDSEPPALAWAREQMALPRPPVPAASEA